MTMVLVLSTGIIAFANNDQPTDLFEEYHKRLAWSDNLTDVTDDDWFRSLPLAIYPIMRGVTETEWAPNQPMTRAMFATILYRLEGEPEVANSTSPFTDITLGQWYSNAVNWAASLEIVTGVGNNLFDPNSNVTREQMAVMLKNYSDYRTDTLRLKNGLTSVSYSSFKDLSDVSDWAQESMKWAVENGLMKGTNIGLEPQSTSTRAQVAQFVYNYTMAR